MWKTNFDKYDKGNSSLNNYNSLTLCNNAANLVSDHLDFSEKKNHFSKSPPCSNLPTHNQEQSNHPHCRHMHHSRSIPTYRLPNNVPLFSRNQSSLSDGEMNNRETCVNAPYFKKEKSKEQFFNTVPKNFQSSDHFNQMNKHDGLDDCFDADGDGLRRSVERHFDHYSHANYEHEAHEKATNDKFNTDIKDDKINPSFNGGCDFKDFNNNFSKYSKHHDNLNNNCPLNKASLQSHGNDASLNQTLQHIVGQLDIVTQVSYNWNFL